MNYSTLGFVAVIVLQAAPALGYKDLTHRLLSGSLQHLAALRTTGPASSWSARNRQVPGHQWRWSRLIVGLPSLRRSSVVRNGGGVAGRHRGK